ncbi:MAG: cellulase family glycosylhydrolase [Clostridium sp.]|nr:cellulase family glycosylhydrolase [Clostridium sp.]MCM1547966.1 cellulase family glycosylhydrolase [Ruminococcus sp.]
MIKKRIISSLLAVSALLACLCSCSDDGSGNTSSQSSASSVESVSQSEKSEDSSISAQSGESVQLIVTLTAGNSWETDGVSYTDYQGVIKNSGSGSVNGWTVTIPLKSEADLIGPWGGSFSADEKTITVTPEEYNKAIEPGSEATFGFQVSGSADAVDTAGATCTGTAGAAQPDQQNADMQNGNSSGGEAIVNTGAKEVPAPSTDDWLSVKGNKIVDSSGKEVWLTGCNWFGYNTGTNCFDGLWACDLNSSLASIADHGFNLLRIPISTELINQWASGEYPEANYNNATNSYLEGMNSLEIFDYVVGQCRANGIKILIDIHCAVTDAMGHIKPTWTDGDITEQDYLDSLSWMADRYKSDDTIIAYDLKNEPHGKQNESPRAKWDDSKDADNWKYVAEKAADAVLSKNENALVLVEGIEIYPKDIKKNGDFKSQNEDDYFFNWWGGNLRGVADNPVDLGKHKDKLVYSPHDYGPAVYEQPWFEGGYTFDSLYKDCWYDNWFYIQEKNIAPLLIGEWGGFMTEPNLTWMTYLRQLISENKINHTFWCFNANSGDTGGLVKDDFMTWDTEKYEFVKEVLWQKDGKFVGLDHKIPLGENGISLSDY